MAFTEASNFKQYILVGTSGQLGTEITSTWQTMRITSSNLTPSATTTQSAEIDPARKAPADIRTNATGSGDIGIEFSADTYDELIRGVLGQDAWEASTTLSAADGFTFSPTTGIIAETSGVADQFSTTAVGDCINIVGPLAGNAAVAGTYVVAELISADSIRVAAGTLDSTSTLLAAEVTAGNLETSADIQILEKLSIGTKKIPVWTEKVFNDGRASPTGDVYFEYYGYNSGATTPVDALLSSWNLSFTPGAISTGSFGISAGFPLVDSARIRQQGATPAPVTTTTVINGMDDVTQVVISPTANGKDVADGREFAARCTEFSFTFDNNARDDAAVGAFGTVNTGLGTPSLSGTLNVYLEDKAAVDYLVANDQLMIACQFDDAAGNKYALAFYEATLTNAETPVTGNNAAVLANLSWSARSFKVSRLAV